MTRTMKLEDLQQKAVDAYMSSLNGKPGGTIGAAVGFGKCFTAYKILYALMNAGRIHRGDSVRIMAETDVRQATFAEEAEKFQLIYGINPYTDFDVSFSCYQAQTQGETFDVLILDEVHEALTPKYSANAIHNRWKHLIGLTATTQAHLKVFRDDETSELTKGTLLDAIAPVVFSYPLHQAIAEGILSPFETTVITHKLDNTERPIRVGKKKDGTPNIVNYSEQGYYNQQKAIKNYFLNRAFVKANAARKMSRLLWNLPSKIPIIQAALDREIASKSIIFGVELDILEQLGIPLVSGRQSKKKVKQTISDFNHGRIHKIGSAKKLKQGITLQGVESCIVASYYSGSHHLIQQLGRIVRYADDKLARLYIIRTEGTLEDRWFDEMQKLKDETGDEIGTLDLNNVETIDSETFINLNSIST